VPVQREVPSPADVDTVTLYLNPGNQKEYYDYILSLHPKRVIFNPGAENEELKKLAEEKKIPVFAFCEDVAASGGYWLACAADEIYADSSSIVGSIGVIAASFGFVDALKKLGVERRVHTAGESKSILDPFQPEKPEDVERLKTLQRDVHEDFKALVRTRRNGKLRGEESELFSGAFWSGRQALSLGLIDGIGHMRDVLKGRFGDKTEFKLIAKPQGWGLRKLAFGSTIDPVSGLIDAIETRAIWGRFGL